MLAWLFESIYFFVRILRWLLPGVVAIVLTVALAVSLEPQGWAWAPYSFLLLIGAFFLFVGVSVALLVEKLFPTNRVAGLYDEPKPTILFLRSFDTSGRDAPVAHFIGVGAQFGKYFLGLVPNFSALLVTDYAEQAIIEAFGDLAEVIVIGRPHWASDPGANTILTEDARWMENFSVEARKAAAIFIVPGTSEGVRWEITHLFSSDQLLSKTLWIMPTDADSKSLAGRTLNPYHKLAWNETKKKCQLVGLHFPDYIDGGAIFRVGNGGQVEALRGLGTYLSIVSRRLNGFAFARADLESRQRDVRSIAVDTL